MWLKNTVQISPLANVRYCETFYLDFFNVITELYNNINIISDISHSLYLKADLLGAGAPEKQSDPLY